MKRESMSGEAARQAARKTSIVDTNRGEAVRTPLQSLLHAIAAGRLGCVQRAIRRLEEFPQRAAHRAVPPAARQLAFERGLEKATAEEPGALVGHHARTEVHPVVAEAPVGYQSPLPGGAQVECDLLRGMAPLLPVAPFPSGPSDFVRHECSGF